MVTLETTRTSVLRRIVSNLAVVALSILVCEFLLRKVCNYQPSPGVEYANIGGIYEPDPSTGWRTRPGTHLIEERFGGGTMSILEDGSRATALNESSSTQRIEFLGDSFTFGGQLDDSKSFPWLIQTEFPATKVTNHGVGGWGTCQSWLKMQQLASESPNSPGRIFFYGLNDYQEFRNVSHLHQGWLVARSSSSRSPHLPVCLLGENGEIQIYPPDIFPVPEWLERSSSLVILLEDIYYRIRSRYRESQMTLVTEQLLRNMAEVAHRHDSRFIVILLDLSPKQRERYRGFLSKAAVEFIDGYHPNSSRMKIPGDGHPDATLNQIWAGQIVEYLTRNPHSPPRVLERSAETP